MNSFLPICNVYLFIFWKKNEVSKKAFRKYLTFSTEIILTHCEELELAELLDPSLRTTDVKKAKAANYICPKD